MPADAAGYDRPTRPPRAGPGAGDPAAPAATAPAGDITRTGGTGQLAARPCPARSPAPDPGRARFAYDELMSGDRELDVVVFGATGFVGRLMAS